MSPKARRHLQSWVALLIVTGIAVYLCWLMVEPFVSALLWAGVLAIVSYPTYARWRARGRGKSAAAALTTLFVVLVVIVPLALISIVLVRQTLPAAESVQSGLRDMLNPPHSGWVQRVARYVDVDHLRDQLRDPQYLGDKLKDAASVVASRTIGIVGGLVGVIVQIFLVLFTLFYLLRDGDRIVPAIRAMLPLEDAQADEVFRRTQEVIHASLHGIVVIAAVQGALGAIAYWALGIRSAPLWGVMTFIASMIPLVGSSLVWVPISIYLLLTGHWIKAVLLLAWGAGVISMSDNILRPRLVGARTRLHELVVFFSVLGGLQVFGVLGLVVGPVVVAVTVSLIDVIRRANEEPPLPVAIVAAANDRVPDSNDQSTPESQRPG